MGEDMVLLWLRTWLCNLYAGSYQQRTARAAAVIQKLAVMCLEPEQSAACE